MKYDSIEKKRRLKKIKENAEKERKNLCSQCLLYEQWKSKLYFMTLCPFSILLLAHKLYRSNVDLRTRRNEEIKRENCKLKIRVLLERTEMR